MMIWSSGWKMPPVKLPEHNFLHPRSLRHARLLLYGWQECLSTPIKVISSLKDARGGQEILNETVPIRSKFISLSRPGDGMDGPVL
jgi:hypothetical protein